ncbi:MAG: 2-dehydropantoate 2-reductase [Clostridia bacterium]|nr:2-dehydropantoate 2-reductase [Clostridia bacterium]
MKIAILGAGAMGSLFGAYLSRKHDVLLVCRRDSAANAILTEGLRLNENDGTASLYKTRACTNTSDESPADVVILFVKDMDSVSALSANRSLIGGNTLLLTLQNGGGHEKTLLSFADEQHVLLGVTQQGAARLSDREIRHTGYGQTKIGSLSGSKETADMIAGMFNDCGLPAVSVTDIHQAVWEKLMTNAGASALTGILQVTIDQIAAVPESRELCETLVREAVLAANADGCTFDADEEVQKVLSVCENSVGGIPSICADIAAGRRTECEAITGFVVRAGRLHGVPVPTHEAVLRLIHALEAKSAAL